MLLFGISQEIFSVGRVQVAFRILVCKNQIGEIGGIVIKNAFWLFFALDSLSYIYADENQLAKEALQKSAELFDVESQQNIQAALDHWDDISTRNELIRLTLDQNPPLYFSDETAYEGIGKKELLNYALETNTAAARQLYRKFIFSLIQTSSDITSKLEAEKKDLITSVNEKLSFRYNHKLMEADQIVHAALEKISENIQKGSTENLYAFISARSDLIFIYNNFLEAKVNRQPTVLEWANELKNFKKDDLRAASIRWKQLFEKEKNIGIRRAWLNRETITPAALAAITAAQAVCIVVTVGVCAATLPATAEWYIVGGRIAMTAARSAVAVTSLIDIIDRYRFNGSKGLLSVATAIDVLLIISAIPGPSLKMLDSTKTFQIFGKTVEASKIALSLSRLKIESSKYLLTIGSSYGLWMIAKADSIAARLSKENRTEIDPQEIRRQGALYVMMGVLGGIDAYRTHHFQYKNSVTYQEFSDARPGFVKRQILGFKLYSPSRSFGNLYSGIKILPQNIWLGAKTTAIGAAVLGYQAISLGTIALMSYTYPDSLMRSKNKPLPELRDGESALLLNGFASNDLLYYAFSSNQANRFEIEKYQSRLGGEFFESASEFFEKIEEFAKVHGKIRYLKIMSHGIPGRIVPIATQDILDGGSRELIDADFIEENKDRIQEIAKTSLAPDAQIVIVSCLVGGNLKKPTSYKGFSFEEKSGDRFINALGQNLLIQNGSIDSSRRIIIGVDGTIAPAIDKIIYNGIKVPHREAFQDEYARIVEKEKAALNEELFKQQRSADYSELAKGMGERVVQMYSQIWALAFKFGFNGEGGLFYERHRHDEFIAGNLVSSSGRD